VAIAFCSPITDAITNPYLAGSSHQQDQHWFYKSSSLLVVSFPNAFQLQLHLAQSLAV